MPLDKLYSITELLPDKIGMKQLQKSNLKVKMLVYFYEKLTKQVVTIIQKVEVNSVDIY